LKEEKTMAKQREEGPGDQQVQLGTRMPRTLHRRLKLYCITKETTLQDFLNAAVEQTLDALEKR
jgi:hypothetical protein